ncbi:replication-associated recombination protein A [Dethiobacter alkaliphilus]|uniref:Replication-associated recombination protein A n=1 Tax=Dethiobacter alkaliphilus AHT 1 TaxID=555088 RepID=C0GDM2_DETAL|nr:replication-associated recombination protein A [Dethiobacter alkaliphilus]EEG78505.1 AAA ATPase central domain protein [Dethiobacter alkaliphilus AHT 1]
MDIFTHREEEELKKHGPLALRLRPKTLEGFAGQTHLVGEGKPLRRLIESDVLSSLLFYGPPGTGKTTLAEIIAEKTNAAFVRVNAVSSSVSELRKEMEAARNRLAQEGKRTVLFVDEIHRFNKAQQDALLPAVEKGIVVLIGATTENPYFTVNAPLLSRMRIFPFEPLSAEDVRALLVRAQSEPEARLETVEFTDEALDHLAMMANGDARTALNALEMAAALASPGEDGNKEVDITLVEEAVQRRAVVYDRDGDTHYDVISAFIKSVRGSDPDAALYWLARMLEAGEDPLFIARRLVILASEDIGNADPHGLLVAVAAADAVKMIGLPEGRITLAQATTYLASAPKSNAAYMGINKAQSLVKKRPGDRVPTHLRDASYSGAKKMGYGKEYRYPHDYPGNFVPQNYLPDGMKRPGFYKPGDNGYERSIKERLQRWDRERKQGEQDE